MYYFDSKLERDMNTLEEIVEKEMQRTKERALRKLSKLVHPTINREFCDILIFAWMESQESAEKIANLLDLGKMDFLAIQEDVDGFREEFLENQEALNF